MKTIALVFSSFAFALDCVAQQPVGAPAKPFVIEAGEIRLAHLVDRCAAYLDCNILISEKDHGSEAPYTVRLQKGLQLDRDDCEELLACMLYQCGFALTRLDSKGTILEAVSMSGSRAREIAARAVQRSPEEVLARPGLKMMVTTVVTFEHITDTAANHALGAFFAPNHVFPRPFFSLMFDNASAKITLMITGMQDQVAQAIHVLRLCDAATATRAQEARRAEDDRFAQLEKRVRALEEQLAKQAATDKAGDKGNTKSK